MSKDNTISDSDQGANNMVAAGVSPTPNFKVLSRNQLFSLVTSFYKRIQENDVLVKSVKELSDLKGEDAKEILKGLEVILKSTDSESGSTAAKNAYDKAVNENSQPEPCEKCLELESSNKELGKQIKVLQESVDTHLSENTAKQSELAAKAKSLEDMTKQVHTQQDQISRLQAEKSEIIKSEPKPLTCYVPNNKPVRLEGSVPIFSKDSTLPVEEWFQILEAKMELAQVPEDKKILLLSIYLRGTASQLARRHAEVGRGGNYADFKEEMIESYTPIDSTLYDRVEFNRIRQDDFKSFEEFAERFQFLSNKLNINANDKFLTFKGALATRYRTELTVRQMTGFTQALTFCKQLELVWASKQKHNEQINFVNTPKTKCMHCGKMGHKGEECWKKHPHQRPRRKTEKDVGVHRKTTNNDKKCYRCGKPGHFAQKCRVRLESIKTIECTNQHEALNKVFNFEFVDKQIPYTYGYVDGIRCKVGFDSGATLSIISIDMVKRHKLETCQAKEVMFKTVDGYVGNSLGWVRQANIDIGGVVLVHDLLIINHNSYDVLLGDNWFCQTGAGLYPALDLLRFPSGEIQLEKRAKEESSKDETVYNWNRIEAPTDDPDFIKAMEWDSDKKEIVPEYPLNNFELKKFYYILNFYKDRFAHKTSDLEICRTLPFNAKLTDDKPIYIRPYRHSLSDQKEINRQVKDLLESGIIRPSKSPYSAPVILVPKADGTKRMCIDYRKINSITVNEPFPVPNIEDLFNKLKGAKIFSVLDFKCGFQQIELNESVRHLFAYSTEDQHVEPNVMQFGMKNAPSHFCNIVHEIIGDMKQVTRYVDEVVIYTETVNLHLEIIKDIMIRLKKHKVKLNPDKCTWMSESIKLLGFVVEHNEIKCDTDKINSITKRLPPRNVKELQEWLGICGYYRRSIKNFVLKVAPMTKLLQKETPFIWSSDCQLYFDELKQCLSSFPVLRMPDFNREFIMHCDASRYAVGVVLSQVDDNKDEYVVSYASKVLKKAELNYTITEKECISVLFGVKKFHTYVYGTDFTVVTDHSALRNIQTPIGRLCRWAIFLQAYSGMKILHREGKKHGNADAISRPVLDSLNIIIPLYNMNHDIFDDDALMFFLKYGVHPSNLNRTVIDKNEKIAKHYKLDQFGVWYRKNLDAHEYLRVPPKDIRMSIIERNHKIGHPQTSGTYSRICIKFYWHNMLIMIKNFINRCETCQRNELAKVYNHPAKAISSNQVFSCINLDYIFGLTPSKEGFIGVLVIVDHVSNWAEAWGVVGKEAEQSLKGLIEWSSRYGTPDIVLSDRGTEFVNNLVELFCKAAHIEKVVTAAYNPRTNGKAERFNQTFIRALRKHCENNQAEWPDWIPFVLMAYRSQQNSITKFSPYELVFGLHMKVFDNDSDTLTVKQAEISQRSDELKNLVDNIRQKANDNRVVGQEKQKHIQNARSNVQFESIPPGTNVLIINDGIIPKLKARYKGPFIIVEKDRFDNYTLKDATGHIVEEKFPLQKLKIITPEENQEKSFEVQKILGHKDENNQRFYLVKWKNYSEDQSEWVNEKDFNTKEIITKYLKKINIDHIPKRPRGRPPKISNIINFLSIILLLITSLSFKEIDFKGKFLLCSKPYNSVPVDRTAFCDSGSRSANYDFLRNLTSISKIAHSRNPDQYSTVADVYVKEDNSVFGVAYECAASKITHTFEKSFWLGHEYEPSVKEKVIPLLSRECFEIVKMKKCYGHSLICQHNACSYEGQVTPEYSRLETIKKISYNCKLIKKNIIANNQNSNLFNSNCKVSDFSCRINGAIIVWDKSVIKTCPFRRVIRNINFEIIDKSFLAKQHNIVLKFKSTEKHCGHQLIKTVEGPFLRFEEQDHSFFNQSDFSESEPDVVDLKKLFQLTLATIDYGRVLEISDLRKVFHFQCQMFKSLIDSFTLKHDQYAKFTDIRGEEIIFYTIFGELYEPKCVRIDTVFLVSKTNKCFMDLPVKVTLNSKNISAFLTNNGIIKYGSETIECNNNLIRSFRLPGSKNLIIVKGKYLNYYDSNDVILKKVLFINASMDDNIDHQDILKEPFSIEHVSNDQITEKYYELETELRTSISKFGSLKDVIEHLNLESVWFAAITIVSIITTYFCCRLGCKLCHCFRICFVRPARYIWRKCISNNKSQMVNGELLQLNENEHRVVIDNQEIRSTAVKNILNKRLADENLSA